MTSQEPRGTRGAADWYLSGGITSVLEVYSNPWHIISFLSGNERGNIGNEQTARQVTHYVA